MTFGCMASCFVYNVNCDNLSCANWFAARGYGTVITVMKYVIIVMKYAQFDD